MTQEAAIAVAKDALEKAGIIVKPEPVDVQQYSEEETNRYSATPVVSGSGWMVVFPLKCPKREQNYGSVYVVDSTGVTYGAQAH